MSKNFYFTIIFLFALPNILCAFIFSNKINQGNKLYIKQKYNEAEAKYRDATINKKNIIALFNLSNSLYRQGKYEESEKYFDTLINENPNNKLKQKAYYNKGNSQFRQQNYEGAIKSYEEALKLNPKDEDAIYNLELAKKMSELPKEKRQQQKNQSRKNNNSGSQPPKSNSSDQNKHQKTDSSSSKTLPEEDAERILQSMEIKHKSPRQDDTQLKRKGAYKIEKDW